MYFVLIIYFAKMFVNTFDKIDIVCYNIINALNKEKEGGG